MLQIVLSELRFVVVKHSTQPYHITRNMVSKKSLRFQFVEDTVTKRQSFLSRRTHAAHIDVSHLELKIVKNKNLNINFIDDDMLEIKKNYHFFFVGFRDGSPVENALTPISFFFFVSF